MILAWPELLDALEERTRQCAALVEGGDALVPDLPGAAVPGSELPLSAAGPVPPELELRARLLLAETRRVEALAARRAEQTRTALRYGQA